MLGKNGGGLVGGPSGSTVWTRGLRGGKPWGQADTGAGSLVYGAAGVRERLAGPIWVKFSRSTQLYFKDACTFAFSSMIKACLD